ncbi:MAG TPA: hypothetical protein VMH04_24235 [Candidatus Solibacter sp.]|nr:hypothetical protein [Candidatus Solibacter sp.]
MKTFLSLAALAIFTFALSASSFARDAHSGSLNIDETVHVGSSDLAPGHYKVEWNGPNDHLQVNFLKNGKTVATAEGHIKNLSERAQSDAVVLKTLSNNTKALDEIDFNKRTEALQFAD